MASCANCSNTAAYKYVGDGVLFCYKHLPLMLRSAKWSHLVEDYSDPIPVKEDKKTKVEEPVVEDATDS